MEEIVIIHNYQTFIQTHYIGPTNHKPARVKAVNVTSGISNTVSWKHGLTQLDNHVLAATALYIILKQDVKKVVCCGTIDNKGYLFTEVKS